MKSFFKLLLVLLLVAVLVAGVYWFFFRYRTDVTADLLTKIGDSKMESQSYETAARYYGWANELQPRDVELSLKLAKANREIGNYTRTERALVNAIYGAPERTDLYVELSKVYIEQDKLMDAQQMLDSIANEQVLRELSERRPAAPTIDPPGGYYSEYITVKLEPGDDAACYFTTNGQFPSLSTDAYTAPVELEGGETTVCAVSVDDEGLVSQAVYVGYTVAGVVEDAEFADRTLEEYVQELLHRGSRRLQTDELWSITELTLPEGLTTLDDLHYFTGLTSLTAHGLPEMDYSALLSMPGLTYLDLSGCTITTETLSQIAACPKLETLNLSGCGLSNLNPLAPMTTLKTLDLSDNSISAIGMLTGLTELESLNLSKNALTVLPDMAHWSRLLKLDLSYNALTTIASLYVCVSLQELNISHNRLTGINAVGSLVLLTKLDASNNQVQDVGSLRTLTKLTEFTMRDNKLLSIDFLANIPSITDVDIDYNDVTAVPDFPDDCKLVNFSAAHNFLEDLSGLGGLQNLSYVNADYNNITDISVLADCPNLTQVNVYGTYVRDPSVLGENDVIVNFTPVFG